MSFQSSRVWVSGTAESGPFFCDGEIDLETGEAQNLRAYAERATDQGEIPDLTAPVVLTPETTDMAVQALYQAEWHDEEDSYRARGDRRGWERFREQTGRAARRLLGI